MKISSLSCLLGVFMATSVAAESVPPRSTHDSRVRETRYVDGQVYVVNTSLTRATTIEFEEGEKIVSIVAGDTLSYAFESIPGDRVFAIKPTARGAETNVTVYTDRRSYYFALREGSQAFYVVRFDYPQRAAQTAGTPPVRTVQNTSYGANTQAEITPISVWDDGAFTYFRFAPNAPVPAVFKVSNGRERSVNSQVVSDRIVRVSGTSQQWALRLGDIEVCIAEILR